MRVEVEVKRAEQSWDLSTKQQQNYLVIEVFGIETRVPCTEEQLVQALSEATGDEYASADEDGEALTEAEPRVAPPTFQQVENTTQLAPAVGLPVAPLESAPTRRLAPMQRPRGDDVGIAQG